MNEYNYRDLNEYMPGIKNGLIHRSAIRLLLDEQIANEFLTLKRITSIVDLRAEKEQLEIPYEKNIESRNIVFHCPMDPWKQPIWFQCEHQTGSNPEIAYRFFIMCCGNEIAGVLRRIKDANGPILIHCHAGKDRTGIICAIIGLLLNEKIENIYKDYLESGGDTSKELLGIVFDYITNKGGIEKYLLEQGMTSIEIKDLKTHLSHE